MPGNVGGVDRGLHPGRGGEQTHDVACRLAYQGSTTQPASARA